jgi:hypothetical protein
MTWRVWVGRILALLWGGWWTFFGVACGIGEGMGFGGTLIHALVPGGIFLAMALISFTWTSTGGYALLGTGIVMLVGYPLLTVSNSQLSPVTILQVLLMIAVPPLLAGALLLFGEPEKRPAGEGADQA